MKMENKENTVRVDKRPSSIYSMVVFLLVFTAVYVFYPQISMWIPFLGENRQIETDYKTVGVADMLDAPVIVVAKCTEKGDTQCVAGGGSVNVYKIVSFETKDAIVGNAKSEFTLTEQGGSALVDNGGSALNTVRKAAESKLGKFTKREIVELCPTLSVSSVEGALRKLVENGELRREGRGKATVYFHLK